MDSVRYVLHSGHGGHIGGAGVGATEVMLLAILLGAVAVVWWLAS
jgi:hypothetical protein